MSENIAPDGDEKGACGIARPSALYQKAPKTNCFRGFSLAEKEGFEPSKRF